MKKIVLSILGMSCVSCAQKIESRLKKHPGIFDVKINFTTGKLLAQTKEPVAKNDLVAIIQNLGYEVEEKKSTLNQPEKIIRKNKNRAIAALLFSFPLMAIMVGKHFFGQSLIKPHPLQLAIEALLTSIVVYWLGWPIHQSALKAIRKFYANMDVLISLGSSVAFLFGVAAFFIEIPVFFEIAAFIISFQLAGRYLEAQAKGRASKAVKELIALKPKTARILKNNQEKIIPLANLTIGDIVLVKPGEMIPADGKVLEGQSTINESIATGESLPITKIAGSQVFQSTINQGGRLKIKVDKIGQKTFLSQIIKLVEEAQGTRVPIQKLANQVTAYFVPIVLIIALITLVVWFWGGQWFKGIVSAITVLIIACPCALGLATPTALTVGIGEGTRKGILFRRGEAIEKLNKTTTIILDKTGTITQGKLTITDIQPLKINRKRFLTIAASLENNSEHLIAKTIVQEAKKEKIKLLRVTDFQAIPGKGIKGTINKEKALIGTKAFLKENGINGFIKIENTVTKLEKEGKTVNFTALGNNLLGLIALADTPKKTASRAIGTLEKMGFEVIMLTGDNSSAARVIADQVKIKNVIAQVLPKEKVEVIKKLQKEGKGVIMVGDGLNDAPALAQADVGIAMGTGADITAETGDIILLTADPKTLPIAIKLSQKTFKVIRQNLFWAFFYNILAIPVAAFGLLATPIGPIIATGAMTFSSLSVILNSLRIKN
ncbi:MAG: heavy metal translocating P-type ATPase [Candidatus Shapirobacteria bacterium]|nr:heavy metal translocating P-type ATPase [Candidatus Shapirobacteria bacterium]